MSAPAGSMGYAAAPAQAAAWRTVPLRRLVLGLAGAISLALCLVVSTVLILNARNAVQEETASAFGLARDAVVQRLPPSFGGRDTMAVATRLADEIDGLRHVSAAILDPSGQPLHLRAHGQTRGAAAAPGWFSRLMTPEPLQELVPITHYPNMLGMLRVASDPTDEIDEVWEDFSIILPVLFLTGLAMLLLVLGLSGMIARRLRLVQQAMGRMQQGELSVRAPADRLTEMAALAAGVNALASHLQAERAENDLLQARLIGSSEAERSRIALDLHDEMGPQLFALRAAVSDAQAMVAELGVSRAAALAETLEAIAGHATAVQKSARTAINDLRPMLLGEATLSELLAELVAGFRDISARTPVILDIDPEAEAASPGELAELSIYRFVRESVLNALRHGPATLVRVTVEAAPGPPAQIVVRVTDNGGGPRPARDQGCPAPSFGQVGMQDRARALGATYLPPWRENRLTHTELRMPRP
ncbi:MAG: LapD/MoxY N-terminal periplasmic domain-containing protein [Paracoccus aminovorans]|nr:LapD/MoxY N-terminal periplasmic domain-containing protein [Paracoccus aminovorans]